MSSWKKKREDLIRKKYVLTDPLLRKSHVHTEPDRDNSEVCNVCGGYGAITSGHTGQREECSNCEGTGEIWI